MTKSSISIIKYVCDRCGAEDNTTPAGWHLITQDHPKLLPGVGDYNVDLCPACSQGLTDWFQLVHPAPKVAA